MIQQAYRRYPTAFVLGNVVLVLLGVTAWLGVVVGYATQQGWSFSAALTLAMAGLLAGSLWVVVIGRVAERSGRE